MALINKLNFSSEWIETGHGEVMQPKLKMKDAVLLAKYRPILEEIDKISLLNILEHQGFNKRLAEIENKLSPDSTSMLNLKQNVYPTETGSGESYTQDPEPEYGVLPYREDIAAGPPITQSDDESLVVDVPMRLIKTKLSDYYALRVRGNSMIDANIPDGSLALIRISDVPRHDAIQVVRIDGRATLKRMSEGEDHGWTLCYEDGTRRTIPLEDDNQVQGTFEAVLPPFIKPRMRGE